MDDKPTRAGRGGWDREAVERRGVLACGQSVAEAGEWRRGEWLSNRRHDIALASSETNNIVLLCHQLQAPQLHEGAQLSIDDESLSHDRLRQRCEAAAIHGSKTMLPR